ncbi:Clp protease N-terminal domain-containing protein [Pseudonocardia sp. TRM90224]|uniref:Clp protease N-terminal domain-containing protein n=1 Tax=Pseudonocardia sp. TRM90224 TaxID=2812678 RepID=UPI00272DF730|nr:Clp protease N-terminal domain-containing protein [Pseudonocardia sp. TRM90224]
MFERFTGEARQVIVDAQEVAREMRHNHIGTEHMLLGVMRLSPDVAVRKSLTTLGLTPEGLWAAVEQAVAPGTSDRKGHIPFTPRAKKVMELSLRESLRLGHDFIGPEHLVLGIVAEGEGVAAQVLARDAGGLDQVRQALAVPPGRRGSVPRTPAAERIVAVAEQIAAGGPVGSHHFLEALMQVDTGMAAKVLTQLGVTAESIIAGVDAGDLAATSDITPEQAAASTMRWEVGEDTATLTIGDDETVARLRALIAESEALNGDGPLAGPFITLHRAVHQFTDTVDGFLQLNETSVEQRRSLRDRLRRRGRP